MPRWASRETRFTENIKVNAESLCWEWQGSKTTAGYGSFCGEYTHRLSFEKRYGPIPQGMHVLHRCDNPCCCNPEHLFLGSHRENMKDMHTKRRHAHGERMGTAKLTDKQVRAIRAASGTHESIAKAFGISRSAITNIRNRKAWAHVADDHIEDAA